MGRFGCRRDVFDGRDHLMRAYLPPAKICPRVDHSAEMSPVRDQGDEGTCVAFAVACGAKEYQERIDYSAPVSLSPRFLYSRCKRRDGSPDEEGTTVRVAMKVLKGEGTCRESYWPYRPYQADNPKAGAARNAARFKEKSYARILDLTELKMSLSLQGPCVGGIQVFSGIMRTKTGLVPMPGKNESPLGGHAVCFAGYDERRGLVKFKNSWGTAWGDAGYGWLRYEYLESYLMDAWSSVDIDDPNPLTLAQVLGFARKYA